MSKGRLTIGAMKEDVVRFQAAADKGEWPPEAVELAAIFENARKKLADLCGEDAVAALARGEVRQTGKCVRVEVRSEDINRFQDMSALCGMSERGASFAAAAIECLRQVQSDTGQGHIVLDLVASVAPRRFVENWAHKLLRAA